MLEVERKLTGTQELGESEGKDEGRIRGSAPRGAEFLLPSADSVCDSAVEGGSVGEEGLH